MTAAAAALLVLVVGLDAAERSVAATSRLTTRVVAEQPVRRFGLPVLALLGAAAVALTGTADAGPSVSLVLVGLVATVGALVVGVLLHRTPRRRRPPDIQ
jgi:hypothetical protein